MTGVLLFCLIVSNLELDREQCQLKLHHSDNLKTKQNKGANIYVYKMKFDNNYCFLLELFLSTHLGIFLRSESTVSTLSAMVFVNHTSKFFSTPSKKWAVVETVSVSGFFLVSQKLLMSAIWVSQLTQHMVSAAPVCLQCPMFSITEEFELPSPISNLVHISWGYCQSGSRGYFPRL